MTRQELQRSIRHAIADAYRTAPDWNALFTELRAYQCARLPSLARAMQRYGQHAGIPTDVFRYQRIATYPASQDLRVFRSSGTTELLRSTHAFADLALYDLAAKTEAQHRLFANHQKLNLIILAPHPNDAPESSLSYMLGRFEEWFATRSAWIWKNNALNTQTLGRELATACERQEPTALLGTSFAFVHAHDALGERQFQLPAHSLIMQTGGFKGKSRSIALPQMLELLAQRFGVPESRIVTEYSMAELSSQCYDDGLADTLNATAAAERYYRVPPWVRVQAVDPITFQPLAEGNAGLLLIEDLANLDSCLAIQTNDLARVYAHGFELLGRAPHATRRGCSWAADQELQQHA